MQFTISTYVSNERIYHTNTRTVRACVHAHYQDIRNGTSYCYAPFDDAKSFSWQGAQAFFFKFLTRMQSGECVNCLSLRFHA